jgi:hypothetical protein
MSLPIANAGDPLIDHAKPAGRSKTSPAVQRKSVTSFPQSPKKSARSKTAISQITGATPSGQPSNSLSQAALRSGGGPSRPNGGSFTMDGEALGNQAGSIGFGGFDGSLFTPPKIGFDSFDGDPPRLFWEFSFNSRLKIFPERGVGGLLSKPSKPPSLARLCGFYTA